MRLHNAILRSYEVLREGSLVGSVGWEWPDAGQTGALIIRHGKAREFPVADASRGIEVTAFLPRGQYEIEELSGNSYRAVVRGSGFFKLARMERRTLQRWAGSAAEKFNADVSALFPIPDDAVGSAGIENINWFKIGTGFVGDVDLMAASVPFGRVAYKFPSGKVCKLGDLVPGLRSYHLTGVQYVSPQGWLVVDAREGHDPPAEGVELGGGTELFWLEPLKTNIH